MNMVDGNKGLMLSRKPRIKLSICYSCEFGKEILSSPERIFWVCRESGYPSNAKQQCDLYQKRKEQS